MARQPRQTLMDGRPGKRPLLLTLLALFFWGMGLVNLGRTVQSVMNVSLLAEWGWSLVSGALAAASLGWAAAFLVTGWGVWSRRRWGRWLGLRLPPIYGAYSVSTILVLTRSPYARGRWLLVALAWAAGSLLVVWVLTRPGWREKRR
jgi:uncharacterized membrane protein (DUF2068 family)